MRHLARSGRQRAGLPIDDRSVAKTIDGSCGPWQKRVSVFTGAFTRGSSVQRHAVAKGTEGNRAGAAQEK